MNASQISEETTLPDPPRILIIEDELPMRVVLRNSLQRKGYEVAWAENGAVGLEKARREKPDLILLDVMMPKLDGFSLCAALRKLGIKTPILMITAKGNVADRVNGLDLGADDYLVKPFSRDELLARVRALLRRVEPDGAPTDLTLGTVRIDFAHQRAWKKEAELHLTAKEFAMLRMLAARPGVIVSRQRFLEAVWGYSALPVTRTLDRHINTLRSKIEPDPQNPRWIKTVHATGYRLAVN